MMTPMEKMAGENSALRKRIDNLERQLEKKMISASLLKITVVFLEAWLIIYIIGLWME